MEHLLRNEWYMHCVWRNIYNLDSINHCENVKVFNWRLKNSICWWKRAGEKAFKLGKMYNKRHISDALVKIFSNAFANSATLPLLKTFCISCWINSNVRSSLYKAFDIDHCAMDEITNNNLAKCDWRGGIMAGVANKFLSGARKL